MAFNQPQMWLTQLFDNFGTLLAGGQIETYLVGTTTPKATFTDSTGLVANTNPVILDSAGRCDIWLAEDAYYKFIVKTAAGVILETVDGVGGSASGLGDVAYLPLLCDFHGGNIGVGERIFGAHFVSRVLYPIDFAGSGGSIIAAPTAPFVMSVRKGATTATNGSQVGTITISTGKLFSFTTTATAPQTFLAGEVLTVWAPAVQDNTASDILITFRGARA